MSLKINLNFNGTTAVVDTFGAELISYQDKNNIEYLWNGNPAFWSGRSPLLFPVIGSLKNSQTKIDGKVITMQKHGFARHLDFIPKEITDASVTLELCDSEETFSVYPFHFRLIVKHELCSNGFKTTYTVMNTDTKVLPFCIGGHVGFNCPLNIDENFEDYILVFEHNETHNVLPVTSEGLICTDSGVPFFNNTNTLPLRHNLFDNDALVFDGLKSRSVVLRHKDKMQGVKMSFPDFPVLALWTMAHKNAPYICIEPWIGLPETTNESGDFIDKPHIIKLPAQQSFSTEYTVSTL
jgi:galactose mutarotase-like enzyme